MSATGPASAGGYRILVVEDAPDLLELLRLTFEGEGYEVLTAVDGLTAVETALRELPDAVVMDMSMPVVDGYNAARIMRREPALAGVPLIACTAHNRWEWRGKAIAAGFDAFMTKPLDLQHLTATLAALLAQRANPHAR